MKKKTGKKKSTAKKSAVKAQAKKKIPKKKTKVSAGSVLKAANQFRKTTKKMVDDVFLKLVGMRVLERAQQMSASLKQEKAEAESLKKKKRRKG